MRFEQTPHVHNWCWVREMDFHIIIFRADSRFVPSQWETALLCNHVSHCLRASLESPLIFFVRNHTDNMYKHDCSWIFEINHICERDDVIKWKHFPRYWPFVRGIHRSPVNSPHKGQWRGALMFSLICVWINCWVNNCESGDLRRYRAHYGA